MLETCGGKVLHVYSRRGRVESFRIEMNGYPEYVEVLPPLNIPPVALLPNERVTIGYERYDGTRKRGFDMTLRSLENLSTGEKYAIDKKVFDKSKRRFFGILSSRISRKTRRSFP